MILPESLSVLRNTPEANSTLSAVEDGDVAMAAAASDYAADTARFLADMDPSERLGEVLRALRIHVVKAHAAQGRCGNTSA